MREFTAKGIPIRWLRYGTKGRHHYTFASRTRAGIRLMKQVGRAVKEGAEVEMRTYFPDKMAKQAGDPLELCDVRIVWSDP